MSVGAVSGIATAGGIDDWFYALNKPFFNPPSAVFGPVWTLLYLLMGISLYLILSPTSSPLRTKAIIIFGFQLALNFVWSFLFFKYRLLGFAFIEIVLIWVSIVFMINSFYSVNKKAAYLQIPYLVWVSFATLLNGSIWFLNRSI
jgi:tryptophan-rich sensory protein